MGMRKVREWNITSSLPPREIERFRSSPPRKHPPAHLPRGQGEQDRPEEAAEGFAVVGAAHVSEVAGHGAHVPAEKILRLVAAGAFDHLEAFYAPVTADGHTSIEPSELNAAVREVLVEQAGLDHGRNIREIFEEGGAGVVETPTRRPKSDDPVLRSRSTGKFGGGRGEKRGFGEILEKVGFLCTNGSLKDSEWCFGVGVVVALLPSGLKKKAHLAPPC